MRLTKTLLLGVCPLALTIAPALAQSTGSEQIETVVVTGTKINLSSGLTSSEPVAKQQSAITQDFIETQTAGQTFFQNLNLLPGFNFTNTDGYGTSGGNMRMHGQDGAHISVTIDGLPLNDTGNYAMYTNQMIDPEITSRVSLNQGTTDVDSPTAAVTGGSIAARSIRPAEDFGVMGSMAFGSNNYRRVFGKVDTGSFGPWGTRAYVAASYSDYDKFTGGEGQLSKRQINAGLFQDMGELGWMNLAIHFNRNRNAFYRSSYYTGAGVNEDNWSYDYDSSCSYTAPTSGTVDYTMTGCSNWNKVRINPSDTGNIRFSSLWHLTSDLTLTADASLQYVLANGGGTTTFAESKAAAGTSASYGYLAGMLIGTSTGGSGTTTTAYGCIAGVGCDLNGDGDVRDRVQVYSPSNTNTRRWGTNISLIYAPWEGHTFRAAYTLDYGVHRQTGAYSFFSPTSGPYDVFGGLKKDGAQIYSADGTALQKRDRNSRAVLQQLSFDYQGSFMDGSVLPSFGFRLPFLHRGLDQHCYTQVGSYYVLCTTEPEASYDSSTGVVTFASTTYRYVRPEKANKGYNKFLPHLGLTVKPFGDEHQFYAAYTQELAAPRTDYLYSSTGTIYTGGTISHYGAYENVKPETSTTYTLGYRFIGEEVNSSLAVWNTQVKNRIVTSWDEEQSISTERNIPGVNYSGFDFDVNYQPFEDLLFYGSASYTSARITVDIPISGSVSADTKDQQLSEVPDWTFAGRVQYKLLPELKLGLGGKYVGRRFASDDNNLRVPDYFTANMDITYDLDGLGMKDSSLRLNVDNIFDRHYYGNISTVVCYKSASGCTSSPSVTPAATRTISVSLTIRN